MDEKSVVQIPLFAAQLDSKVAAAGFLTSNSNVSLIADQTQRKVIDEKAGLIAGVNIFGERNTNKGKYQCLEISLT